MTESVASRGGERRKRILDAAAELILRVGLRAATMEAIARAAGVAKPTLYNYFPDKDAVFAALIEGIVEAKLEAFSVGFAGSGSLATRLGEGLAGKCGVVADLLDGSPHANELLGEHNRLAQRFASLDAAIAEQIVAELEKAGIADAAAVTEVLMAACYGILVKVPGGEATRAAVRVLCARMVGEKG